MCSAALIVWARNALSSETAWLAPWTLPEMQRRVVMAWMLSSGIGGETGPSSWNETLAPASKAEPA